MWTSNLFKTGIGVLLLFLIIFIGSQISFIFHPFIIAFEALFISFLISGILYYLTYPLVDWLHNHKFPRPAAIFIVYLLIVGMLVLLGLLESPWMMFQVMIIIVVVQQLESLLISPQVMGRKLALSPLAIILIVLVAGRLGGLLGIILAIPTFTVLKIIFTHVYEHIQLQRGKNARANKN